MSEPAAPSAAVTRVTHQGRVTTSSYEVIPPSARERRKPLSYRYAQDEVGTVRPTKRTLLLHPWVT